MRRRIDAKRVMRADVLVLVMLCAFLLMTVPLLFARTREAEVRVLCGSNLGQIGKAMLVYAEDYDGALPRAGGATTVWGHTRDWTAFDRYNAFGMSRADESGGTASISSCFYMLVKYAEMPTRVFVCGGDEGATEFKLADVPPKFELTDAWDFGFCTQAPAHCSYAYHMPFGLWGLTTSRDPNLAVAADRNPWITSPGANAGNFAPFMPDIPPYCGSAEMARAGNAVSHQNDGQNVLFLDGRVNFETRSYCGTRSDDVPAAFLGAPDNIYTLSQNRDTGDPRGMVPPVSQFDPANECDSVLVHDPPDFGGGRR